ncbi:MAG: hypothetical protein JST85_11815 [Acidobacteria bacterium]|nr:hypothetical protein [Acidobacteriota bacterium]
MLMFFPVADPIPLPAPVWLFKLLHIVTLSLHFVMVFLMAGGLFVATVWNFLGRRRSDSVYSEVAGAIAKKLPVVMTYLINFGVPPLLFAQVLYGQALYTSSVLIGAYWISVIFLLMAAYYLLYQMVWRNEAGRPWWLFSLLALILVGYIGRIYVSNMTLMLRPEVWAAMYEANPSGTQLPTGDPTILPRFLFMAVGSLGVAGAALALFGVTSKQLSEPAKLFARRWGGALGGLFIALQLVIGVWVYRAQPAGVKEALFANAFYKPALLAWLAVSVLTVISLALTAASKTRIVAVASALLAVVGTIAATTVRDGIRDLTLQSKGLNVWDQPVVANWSVVILFLVLFVASLGVVGWLAKVVMNAQPLKGAKESHV